LRRFSDREDLGVGGVLTAFWTDLPRHAALEFFRLVELEYGLNAGLLRPDDPVSKFSEPIRSRNPLTWLFLEGRLEDAYSELAFQLGKRLDQAGTRAAWQEIQTTDDLLRAWCGAHQPGGGDV
jgi:hypothetical protein